ncbi:hypothetical protein BZM27_15715 [Paraburkholderia steynii]|uniref:Uncharacterized protein n=1 Tax=Paraburkholderia steynii TaxID=1245441 RepID=A0A4R0XFI9_9BURK|nr:hypothetical protein BZM27_15715 [Paraburkholderia steynii]
MIDRLLEVALTLDLDAGLIDAPVPANRALVTPERLLQHRKQFYGPTMHGRMIDQYAAFFHHLFQISHTQPADPVLPHAHQHCIKRVVNAGHGRSQGPPHQRCHSSRSLES